MALMKIHRKPKEEEPDRIWWRTRFERGYEPVVRQTAECSVVKSEHCSSSLRLFSALKSIKISPK